VSGGRTPQTRDEARRIAPATRDGARRIETRRVDTLHINRHNLRAANPPSRLRSCGGLYQWISSAYQSSVATAEDLGGILIGE
jgi:hypothetical protein